MLLRKFEPKHMLHDGFLDHRLSEKSISSGCQRSKLDLFGFGRANTRAIIVSISTFGGKGVAVLIFGVVFGNWIYMFVGRFRSDWVGLKI